MKKCKNFKKCHTYTETHYTLCNWCLLKKYGLHLKRHSFSEYGGNYFEEEDVVRALRKAERRKNEKER